TQGLVDPARQANVRVCECSSENENGLKYHHRIHRCATHDDSHEEEQSTQHTFYGMVTKSCGHIHIIIGMVHHMKTPKQRHFMFGDVHQPSSEEIKCEKTDDDGPENRSIQPIHKTKLIVARPIAKKDDDQREKSMNDDMNYGEAEVYRSVPDFRFTITHRKQRNRSFDNPEKQQPSHQNRHAFQRPLFKRREVFDDGFPHESKLRSQLAN